jgi:hypothetical protein
VLNLPTEKHSHGLRRLAAIESARGSFAQAVQAIERITGQRLGKRQVQQPASRAAGDVDRFYAQPRRHPGSAGEVLVLSCDGKGIVMGPEGLRQATRKQADASAAKLATRLSKGEKRHRKRMAEVGGVYHCAPASRTPGDILPATGDQRRRAQPGPTARSKWLVASVVADAAEVITQIFDEATRRDPDQRRCWVALVDGNNHQIERIQTRRGSGRCRWPSWSTSSTCSNTSGRPHGASSPRATRPPSSGSATTRWRSLPDAPARWQPPSGAKPPAPGWTPRPQEC